MDIEEFPKITIILRGYNYNQIFNVAKVLSESKFDYAVEITLNADSSFSDIEQLSIDFPNLLIGAGTVTTLAQATKSIESGAKFLLSPIMFNQDILNLCQLNGVISIPGAYTPSEVKLMIENGADIVKIFPANTLKPKYFSDIQAPLGSLNLMAVGGINTDNALIYLKNNVKYLGIGSGIFNKTDIKELNLINLTYSLNEFENLVLSNR